MVSPSSNLLLAGGLGLLIGIGGGATGALLVDRTPAPAMPPAVSTQSGIPASAIAELTAEMRSLRETLEARSSAPSTPGEPRVPATDPSADRLERAVARLTEALENPRASLARSALASGVEHQNIKPKQTALLEEVCAVETAERTRPYYFWSLQEVLDRFGKPDNFLAQADQRFCLIYELEGQPAYFYFTNGMLFAINP